MDSAHDQPANGRAFRVFTVIDKWSRESVFLETSFFARPGQSVLDDSGALHERIPAENIAAVCGNLGFGCGIYEIQKISE